jgi:hypothetical protein
MKKNYQSPDNLKKRASSSDALKIKSSKEAKGGTICTA